MGKLQIKGTIFTEKSHEEFAEELEDFIEGRGECFSGEVSDSLNCPRCDSPETELDTVEEIYRCKRCGYIFAW